MVRRDVMRAIPVLLLVFLSSLCLPLDSWGAGGDIVWQYNDILADNQDATASAVDSAGNLFVVGSTGSLNTDIRISKLGKVGVSPETLWSVTHVSAAGDDGATAVVVDHEDNVIVTGYLWSGGSFNDIYTAKYNGANGVLIWEHTFDGSGNGNDHPTAIAVDDVGFVYVAGYMQDATTKDSTILLKYDKTTGTVGGNPLWQYSYDGLANGDVAANGNDRLYALAVSSAGVAEANRGVVVTGEMQDGDTDFDCLTIKYKATNISGLPDRVWTYSDAGNGRGQALAMDSLGNAVMGGYVSDGSNQDYYTIEYPAGGGITANWAKIHDSTSDDKVNAIWLDDQDNVYVVGGEYSVLSGVDIYVAKHAGDTGTNAWRNSYNTSGFHNDTGLYIVGDNAGELFVSGYKNDGEGGDDDILTLKVKKDDGTLLWSKEYDNAAANQGDRATGAGLVDGSLLIGGWTAGGGNVDFLAIKYESGGLNPPTSLAAAVISNSQVDLSWTDNSTGEDGFTLERKIGAFGGPSDLTDITKIDLGANVTSYSDSGLSADTRYFYRINANSVATGASAFSNEVNVKTTIVSEAAPALQFQYGGVAGQNDFAAAIAVGPDNHPVVTGSSIGAASGADYYTIKLDRADLTEQWHAVYGNEFNEEDEANGITVDSHNRVVVTGFSSLYVFPAPSNTNDVYTLGYPADGSVVSWDDQYNGPDGNDDRSSAVASAIDGSDNTVVVGYGNNNAGNNDIYVIKFLPDGTRDWAIVPYDGGYADLPTVVRFDFAGDVLVAGSTHNGTNTDFFVAKYSGVDGSETWVKTFNGAGNGDDKVNALAVDASGNVYVTGAVINAAGNSDIYTIKYAGSAGTLLWEDGVDGVGNAYDVGEGIEFDPVDGNIMVGGTTFVASGNHDYFLTRYAADGTVLNGWPKTLDRPGSDEALYAMSIDRSGTVCLTGTTDAGGNDDVLTVKYDSDGLVVGASVYNGVADGDDAPAAVTTNNYGETFVAGFTSTAGGDADYMVFLADGGTMQSPAPFTATQLYTQVALSWNDNSLTGDDFSLQFKPGSCSAGGIWTDFPLFTAGETSYSHTGLSIDSTFCYRIRSVNSSGDFSRWAELEVTTDDPIAPSGLTATVLNTTEVQLDWTDNTGIEDKFLVERCTGTGCVFPAPGDAGYVSLDAPADATTFVDTTACPGETYSYRIKADHNEWTTAFDETVAAANKTTDSTLAPTDFTVTLISENQVDLTWTDNSTDEDGFSIERCAGSGCSNFAEVDSVLTDEVSFSDTGAGVLYETLYRYRVTAKKDLSCAVPAYTQVLEVTTTPPAPSVTAVPISSTQISLSWVDGTAAEAGFKVERCLGSGCTPVEIASVAADATMYADKTVCAGGDYRYRVRAYSAAPWDSASGIVDVTAPVLQPPSFFNVTTLSEDQVKVDWSMSGYDHHGYLLERCIGGGCTPAPQYDFPNDQVLVLSMEDDSWAGADKVTDSSGKGNHGTSYNGAVPVAVGKYSWAGDFNGTDAYIVTPLIIDQSSGGPGATFEAWVYPYTSDGNWRTVISTESSNNGYDWSLARHGTAWRVYHGSSYWTIGTVTPGFWQHVMVVFEPGVGVRFYQDGAMSSSTSIAYDDVTGPVNIGRRTSGGYYFDGKIDEVKIYARALTNTEALARYNSGNTTTATISSLQNESGLTSGASYGYRVKSYRNDNCVADSLESLPTVTKYATTMLPQAPTGFSATMVDSTRINLAWSDNTTTESGFILKRCPGSGTACDSEAEFITAVDTPTIDAVSYVDQGVCYGQTYTYRLVATHPDGAPNWPTPAAISNSATTLSVATPVDFAATATSESEIALSWTDNLVDEDSYTIKQCAGSGTACDEPGEFSPLITFDNRQTLADATLWLKMEEASWGTVVNSAAGGSNPYRYQALLQADAERGKAGYFDGSNDYLRFTNYAGIDPSAAITLSTWAKSATASWNSSTSLISKRNSYVLGPDGAGGMHFWVFIGGTWAQLIVADVGVDITEWHQYTGTYDGANLILYVDGLEVGRLPYSGNITADTGYLYLGLDDGMSRYFNGWMDDVLVFNRALSPTEAQSLVLNTGATSYVHQGLSPTSTFTYRLSTEKASTCPWPTDVQDRTATTFAPPPPTGLSAVATSTSTIDINWNDNSGSESGYNLERCLWVDAVVCADPDNDFTPLAANLPADTTSYTDTTAYPGTKYSYHVRAEKGVEAGWPTAWDGPQAVTTSTVTSPGGLAANRVSEVQIDLTWIDNSSDESGFEVQRCRVADCGTVEASILVSANATSYQDDQLSAETTYFYRIRGVKAGANGWPSAFSLIASDTTVVTAPSALLAEKANTTQIDLSWTDNSATETRSIVERCTNSGCSDFVEHGEVIGSLTNYSDVDACSGTTYNYRLKIANDGLDGGGTWTRRVTLNFSSFSGDVITRVVVPYDADMRADFGDLRFYDDAVKRQLPYYIESKTDGVTATVRLLLSKNPQVLLYYGNAAASDAGREDYFILFRDDFSGTQIDAEKWLEIDPDDSIGQNDGLLLTDITYNWNKNMLISQQAFDRVVGRELYFTISIAADTPGGNYMMTGWRQNIAATAFYNTLVHSLYWSNYSLNTRERGSTTGGTGSYVASTSYEVKVVLKAVGAKYYIKGGAFADWTLINETSTYSDSKMQIAFSQVSQEAVVHTLKVQDEVIDTGSSLGAEEASVGFAFVDNVWLGATYSNESEATTDAALAPSDLAVTAISDTQIQLTWTDNTAAESSFAIDRCLGGSCTPVLLDSVATDVTSYIDATVLPSTEYSYLVRAVKSSSCPWFRNSGISSDTSFPAASSSLTVNYLNSQAMNLVWADDAVDEDGYRVEVRLYTGDFVEIADLPAGTTNYVDRRTVEELTEYTYRVRPYRGFNEAAVFSPYSELASDTTPAFGDQENKTCYPGP